jgi:hypothetical protein
VAAERHAQDLGFDLVLSSVLDRQDVYGMVDLDIGNISSVTMDSGAHFSIDGIDIHLTPSETKTIQSVRELIAQVDSETGYEESHAPAA